MYEVFAFIQPGCPACESIHEPMKRIGAHYRSCSMWRFVDASREGLFADRFLIRETPTVIGTYLAQPVVRIVGAQDFEKRLVQLYGKLLAEASCPVPQWRGDV